MRKQSLYKWTIFTSLILTLMACASQPQKFSTQYNQYELKRLNRLDDKQKAELYETIIAADLAADQKDHLTAMSYYLHAADLSQNISLISKAIEQAEYASDPLGLEQAANIWLKAKPNNSEALKVLLKSQLTTNQADEAIGTINRLLKVQKTHSDKYQLLVNELFEFQPNMVYYILKQLLETSNHKLSVAIAQAKFIMNLTEGKGKAEKPLRLAYDNIEKVLSTAPDFYEAIQLKSQLLYNFEEDQKARNFLLSKHRNYPDSKPIAHLLGQFLYDTQDYQNLLRVFTPWIKKYPDDNTALLFVAAGNFHLHQYENSLKYFTLMYQRNFKTDLAYFYCGESAFQTKQVDIAENCYQKVSQGEYLANARIKQARLISQKKQYQAALDLLTAEYALSNEDKIELALEEVRLLNLHFSKSRAKQSLDSYIKKFPADYRLILSKIEIYELYDKPKQLVKVLREAQDGIVSDDKLNRFNLLGAELLNKKGYYREAIKWLDDAIKQTDNQKELKYTRTLYRENLGQYSLMIKEFKALLKDHPDDINIKNALGYTLADRNLELEYAQSLIDSAYQHYPNNAAIIDSKGWLAYRLGQLDAAEEYLKRAFKLYPAAEVAAHLGEVLWIKKDYENAKSVWRSGLKIDQNNRILKETLERFKLELEP